MKKIFGVSAVILIVIIASLGYRSYKHSPLYSLKQAAIALKTGNTETAKKYIDFSKIINGIFEEQIAKDEEIKNNPFAVGMIEMFKGPMVAAIQTALLNAIEEGVKRAKEETNNTQSAQNPQSRNKLIKKVKVLTKKKDFATVQIVFSGNENKKDMPLIVGMQKIDNYWQAVKIMNFDEVKDADFWDEM